ncbi:serine O-acetyltransferase [Halomonas sp. G11]|uniref:serine O-acetyltransferase n=1 Tax=Halomonas sp. G11 TaxID=1684425 RepID=UPI0007FE6293|nr:serine O-acetyltransferase [Halomonas sp. G11]OAZ96724.1 hypothetical protein ADS46_17715 [Halomonas sp. G11]
MFSSRLLNQMGNRLEAIVYQTLANDERVNLRDSGFLPSTLETVANMLVEDLEAFVQRDPAARGCSELILDASSSFRAVMHYRLAHQFWHLRAEPASSLDLVALKLSSQGKLNSGIDIHPGARIGSRFVLDHAYGTVIGETCRIGDDAYILGGVTLGSLGIANNPQGQRHPTLGNNVEVGAFARVLGPIEVGNNVFISPNCVVTKDIPDNTRVLIVNQIQLEKPEQSKLHSAPRFIGSYVDGNRFVVLCHGFRDLRASLLDKNYQLIVSTAVSPSPSDSKRYDIQFPLTHLKALDPLRGQFHVSLSDSSLSLTLLNPEGLSEFIARIRRACHAFPGESIP